VTGSATVPPETINAETINAETGAPETPTPETTSTAPDAPATTPPRTGNLSGYCEAQTQMALQQALVGTASATSADPLLWAGMPVLPLLQPSTVFAVEGSLEGVLPADDSGWTWTGPLNDLPRWPAR
jgi:hypothetical protein